jgi:hypothetical protein
MVEESLENEFRAVLSVVEQLKELPRHQIYGPSPKF